jgi:hypothetical protein
LVLVLALMVLDQANHDPLLSDICFALLARTWKAPLQTVSIASMQFESRWSV